MEFFLMDSLKMVMTPSSFTYEHLSSLKFKELQKLSVQFRVNKRWAKKQELIENLLALKEKHEEQEWRDASAVFSDLKDKNEKNEQKRLTFNVAKKSNPEYNDAHLTFEVPPNGKNLLCEAVNSRDTYDIPSKKTDFGDEILKESRATFEIPPKLSLMNVTDSRATFEVCKTGEKLLDENTVNRNETFYKVSSIVKNVGKSNLYSKEKNGSELKQKVENLKKFDIKIKNVKKEKEENKAEVKLLTIPYARVGRRTRAGEASKNDPSPIKMSKKSINIKKSTRLPVIKTDLMKSPALSSIKKSNKEMVIQSLTKNQPGKIIQSKVPKRLQFTQEKPRSTDKSNKENVKILRMQISKTEGETVNKKPNPPKVDFRSSVLSMTKSSKSMALKKTPLRRDTDRRLNSNTGEKLVTKPIITTKMPDFSKIHKKQFEQMDSLHDYIKKKEDRIRKLFGTPQPGQQLHNLNKSAPIFHFQSTNATKKENKENNSLKIVPATPLKKREKDSKLAQKEAFKAKLWTDIKDKNRSHIHGVRTNKRFELQMKFRNI